MFVKITDLRGYQPESSRTGGNYGYSAVVGIRNGQIVLGRHDTTAVFGYCPRCARFVRDGQWRDHDRAYHHTIGFQPGDEIAEIVRILTSEGFDVAETLAAEKGLTIEMVNGPLPELLYGT